MQKKPKVGIVVLKFNRLSLLKITLCKLFDQTYTNYEIVVVDNFSEDGAGSTRIQEKTFRNCF